MRTILIVGAGPTGLTLAAVLARYGVHARIIDERVTPPEDRSRAVVLQARTLELFRDLGIDGEVDAEALHVDGVTLYLPSGKRDSLTIRREWIDSRFNRLTSLPQDETERILTGLLTRSGIQIERGCTLTAASETEQGVACTLAHADGRVETTRVDFLVGADGAHSAVRRAAGLSFDGETYDDEAMLADVDIEWSLAHDEVTLCPGGAGFLLAFPLPGERRFRIIVIRPASAPAEQRSLERAEFLEALRAMLPPGEPMPRLAATRWLTRYRLHRRGVPRYRSGRMFVAGDAAHIHSPVGAQGMNTGIQDSYNLGWKLGLVATGLAPESLLESYDAERRPVGERLLKGTDMAFGFLARGGRFARFLRTLLPGVGIRLIGTGVVGRRLVRLVSQTGIRYRHSPAVENGPHAEDLPDTAPHAGDRLPDLGLIGAESLHDRVRGPEHVLLAIGNLAGETRVKLETMRKVPAATLRVITVEDAESLRILAGAQPALYLIRPDKHVAFRGTEDDVEALAQYVQRVLVGKKTESAPFT